MYYSPSTNSALHKESPMTPSPVLTYTISYKVLTLCLPFNFKVCQFNKHLQPLTLCKALCWALYMP